MKFLKKLLISCLFILPITSNAADYCPSFQFSHPVVGDKEYYIHFIVLDDVYKDLQNVKITYRVKNNSWVTKPMEEKGKAYYYVSNRIDLSNNVTLSYRFEYDYKNAHCSTETFEFKRGRGTPPPY